MSISTPTALGSASVAASAISFPLVTTVATPVNALIIVRVAVTGNLATPVCMDTAGNIYTLINDVKSGTANRPRSVTFKSIITTELPAGGTITVSGITNGTSTGGIGAEYWTGVSDISDGTMGSASSRTGTIATSNPNNLFVGAMAYSATSTYTEAATFTSLSSRTVGTMLFGAAKILSATATQGWQPTMGTNRNYAWQIFALKESSDTPAPDPFVGFGVPL